MHTIVLPLAASPNNCRELEARFNAGFQLYRAVVREGLRRLDLMRESRAWQKARKLPQASEEQTKTRNKALNTVREEFGVTESELRSHAGRCRMDSGWMSSHLDSQTASNLGTRAWQTLAGHMFQGKGRPHIPRWHEFSSIDGAPPNYKDGKWQSVTLTGAWNPETEAGLLPPTIGRWGWAGPLHLSWNAKLGTSRILNIRVKTHNLSPLKSHARAREEHALRDKTTWRYVSLVRKRIMVGHEERWTYSAHLLVELPAWRATDRYSAIPDHTVGLDLGPGTLAAVAHDGAGVSAALLVRASDEDLVAAKAQKLATRRRARAIERSRRANNPEAYAPGRANKNGRRRKHAGSYKPGHKLIKSSSERRLQAKARDSARIQAEERARRINDTAIKVVTELGKNIRWEAAKPGSWTGLWGGAVGRFAPGALTSAIEREAVKAGGSFTAVPTSLALSQRCVCGSRAKKPLSQRVHTCDCEAVGAGIHRDLWSAFLISTTTKAEAFQASPTSGQMFNANRAADLWSFYPDARLCVQAAALHMNETSKRTKPDTPVELVGLSGDGFELVAAAPMTGPDPAEDVTGPAGEDCGKGSTIKGENHPPRGNSQRSKILCDYRG